MSLAETLFEIYSGVGTIVAILGLVVMLLNYMFIPPWDDDRDQANMWAARTVLAAPIWPFAALLLIRFGFMWLIRTAFPKEPS